MALKETFKHMKNLLTNIVEDLEKADGGNKAASQRVRTGTVKLEKVAKQYRKESIQSEKTTKGRTKKAAPKAAKAKAHKAPAHKASASKSAKPKAQAASGKTAAKSKKTATKPRPMSFKRPTAKLPTRRAGAR